MDWPASSADGRCGIVLKKVSSILLQRHLDAGWCGRYRETFEEAAPSETFEETNLREGVIRQFGLYSDDDYFNQ
ncbi:ADP-ribose pyrophosphatase YjhB (NUDIX family) [Sporosarcina luteola]|nr:ADP-ribose pyrophosphatase YjhB (NUDIX family) [Sporosarcina luteola]